MTDKLEQTIKHELECVVKDAQKTLSSMDWRTIDYEISLIESHISVIRGELELENRIRAAFSISPESI